MSQYALHLPDSLLEAVRRAAKQDGVSINQFLVIAAAEKISALQTAAFFEEKARKADFARYQKILDKIPAAPPVPGDEIN